ncbi:2307_t:CDS:2, partial [Entrophospora sp. SA101]
HEKEIQELKFQVSDLQKRLRLALKDADKKEGYIHDLEQQLSTFEEEVIVLKKKIQELTFQKYNKSVEIKDSLNIVKMSQPIQPDPIQPPSPNELNNLLDTLLDENIHIDEQPPYDRMIELKEIETKTFN